MDTTVAASSNTPEIASNMEKSEPFPSLVVRLILSALIFVLNIVGNVFVIIVVKRSRKLRSCRNYYYGLFLVSLSVADLAVGLFCMPFILLYYETGKYPFGFFGSTAVCKLIPALSLMANGASIFSLTCLTTQRYMGVVHPLKARLTLTKVRLVLVLIWLFAFLNVLPQIIVMDVQQSVSANQFSCYEFWDSLILREGYTLYLFLVEYMLPLLVIGVTYTRMALVLNKKDDMLQGKRNTRVDPKARHRKFIRLLIVLIVSFALCYLPNHVLFFWLDYGSGETFAYFSILMKYSHFCIWLNSCLNPYLYGALDEKFRQGYKKALLKCARFGGRARQTHARITRQLTKIYSMRTSTADGNTSVAED